MAEGAKVRVIPMERNEKKKIEQGVTEIYNNENKSYREQYEIIWQIYILFKIYVITLKK